MRTFRSSRGARLLAAVATAGLVLAACGGGATPTPAPTAPPASGEPGATPAGGYTGPEVTITYAIWGDPAELKSQQAVVDSFHAANPKITVDVSVSDWDAYWDKVQTGIAGGAAPDVFAMDGPLFPDYQSRGVLLDLKPFIDRDGYDLTQLADQGVADFTTADGGQYGLPRDLNTVVLYYNKAMFDAAGVAYPDDTWDWAKLVEAGKQLTKDVDGDGTVDQWGFYTETTDMENFWLSAVWQNGGDVMAPDGQTTVLDTPEAAGGIQFLQDLIWKEKVMADPAIFAETGDAFENGQGRDGVERLLAGPDPRPPRASTSASPRSPRGRPAGSPPSTPRAPSSTRAPRRPTRRGSS